jgi:hypothetical protein
MNNDFPKQFETNSMLADMDHWQGWSGQDSAELRFLQMKYRDRAALCEEWIEKRKIAAMNKESEDGKASKHYPRMAMEADIARMAYEMAYILEQNSMMQEQINILTELYQRVALLEGAYTHLSQSTEYVKNQYKDSMRKHYEDRKEYQTCMAMQKAGLDSDSKEDRLKWAAQLDKLVTNIFQTTQAKE